MPSVSICRSWWWAVVVVIVCLVLLPSFTVAQTYTSSWAGKVRDASGAAVPGAKVSIERRNETRGRTRDERFPVLQLPDTSARHLYAHGEREGFRDMSTLRVRHTSLIFPCSRSST